jgi:hypothetical protein
MELKRIISGIDGAINNDIFAPHKPKNISLLVRNDRNK